MVIFSVLCLGVFGGALLARKTSETTVYDSIAESVSHGFLEQLRGEQYTTLSLAAVGSTNFNFIVLNTRSSAKAVIGVKLNSTDYQRISIPVNSDTNGNVKAEMAYDLRVSARASATLPLIYLTVEYRYVNPVTKATITRSITTARSATNNT